MLFQYLGNDFISNNTQYATMSVDLNKFNQVIRNLVSNALKFTPPEGEVRVYASIWMNGSKVTGDLAEHVSEIRDGGDNELVVGDGVSGRRFELRVDVHDSGPGISKENQSRLFREIIQFDAADLQGGKGSGLGLWSK